MNYTISGFAANHVGQREHNEDAFLVNDETKIYIVADGMGGHDKGEVASQFTTSNLGNIVKMLKSDNNAETDDGMLPVVSDMSMDKLLQFSIFFINRQIFDANEQAFAKSLEGLTLAELEVANLGKKKKRMGTTLVSLFVCRDKVFVTNIGDSRAYRIQGNSIVQITEDHSQFEEKKRMGLLTEEEMNTKKGRNIITRAVGTKGEVMADTEMLPIDAPERYLLCSDGLSNVLDKDTLLSLGQIGDIKLACKKLVNYAADNGGRDNITALLVDIKPCLNCGNKIGEVSTLFDIEE